jgi:hypothetical protein
VVLQLDRLGIFLLNCHPVPLLQTEFIRNFVVLADATMPFTFAHNFFHELAITVQIYHCCPLPHTNHIHLDICSDFEVALLAFLEILQLEYSSFSSFHADHKSLNLKMVLSKVVLDLFLVHEVHRAKVSWMLVDLVVILFLQRPRDYLLGGNLLVSQRNSIESGWLIDFFTDSHNCFEDM